MRDAVRVVLEAAPAGMNASEVAGAMTAHSLVVSMHDFHVWEITSGIPALSAHVLVRPNEDCHAVRGDLERILDDRLHIDHTTLQVDHPHQQPPINVSRFLRETPVPERPDPDQQLRLGSYQLWTDMKPCGTGLRHAQRPGARIGGSCGEAFQLESQLEDSLQFGASRLCDSLRAQPIAQLEHLKAFSVEAQFGQQLAHFKPRLRLSGQEMATAGWVSRFRSWSRR